MILQSVIPICSTIPAENAVKVVEWRTYRDERNNKVYSESRQYTIHLYTANGLEKEYTNRTTVDVKV